MFSMNNINKKRGFFIKGLITIILVIGLGYTIYTNLIETKEETADESNLAPNFTLEDLQGKKIKFEDYRGKGVLLNFWATYCPPCEKEMPYLESAYKDYKNKGVEVLAVDVGEPRIIVNQFVSKKELSFPVLLDWNADAADLYEVNTLPVTFLINEKGEITEKISGEMTEKKIYHYVKSIVPE